MFNFLGSTYSYTTTSTSASSGGGAIVLFLIYILIIVAVLVGLWKVFAKAGEPGWAAIIPFYNIYTLLKIAGRPGWWLILYLIPVVNLIVGLVVALDVAKNFGKSPSFGVIGLWLFSMIGYLILGFGDSKYVGSGSSGTSQ